MYYCLLNCTSAGVFLPVVYLSCAQYGWHSSSVLCQLISVWEMISGYSMEPGPKSSSSRLAVFLSAAWDVVLACRVIMNRFHNDVYAPAEGCGGRFMCETVSIIQRQAIAQHNSSHTPHCRRSRCIVIFRIITRNVIGDEIASSTYK